MTLSPEAYAALEAAVGPRFVSKEPAFALGACWIPRLVKDTDGDPSERLPVAVVMPSSVEEVAAVVKACNRHGINFRAFSVGWMGIGAVSRPNSIAIDLRRMNDLEIDEHNMVATIGPYVTAGQLMAEAMKKGLTCHVVGAGATHSPLASATSGWGIGVSGSSTGHNARNLLSLEWVTPEGEIVKIGSAGSGLGWGISDGPGPGFRGMIRGFMGAMGGIGVFTKIGYRLHPWHGPRELEYTGQHPQTGIRIGDNRIRYYHAVWPTWDDMQKASFELNASAVATAQLRMPPESIAWTLTKTNNEYLTQLERNELPALARQENGCAWSIVTVGYSDRHDAYNDKVIRHIVERTGGKLLDVALDHAEIMARTLVTSCYVPRVMRPTKKSNTSLGVFDSFRLMSRTVKATEDVYATDDIARKYLHTVGTEQNWMWPTERRTFWSENLMSGEKNFDTLTLTLQFHTEHALETQHLGFNAFLAGPAIDISGQRWGPNLVSYQRGIKNLYDPKNLSDPILYIQPKPMPLAWGWKYAKKFLFKPGLRGLVYKIGEAAARSSPF